MALLAALMTMALTGCQDFYAASWGGNGAGQLGDGSFVSSPVPVAVNTDQVFRDKTIVQSQASAPGSPLESPSPR